VRIPGEVARESAHFSEETDAPFWKSEETPAGERWVVSRAEDEAARQRWTPGTS
jgi:hypothetical protein